MFDALDHGPFPRRRGLGGCFLGDATQDVQERILAALQIREHCFSLVRFHARLFYCHHCEDHRAQSARSAFTGLTLAALIVGTGQASRAATPHVLPDRMA